MDIIKLDETFIDYDGAEMDVFLVKKSDIEEVPSGTFILDHRNNKTEIVKIVKRIKELHQAKNYSGIREFTYSLDEINLGRSGAEQFLKQLRRDLVIDSIV